MIETTVTARTKWCPMVRQVWCSVEGDTFTTKGDTPAFNTAHQSRGSREYRCPCIATDCMMWQNVGSLQGEGCAAVTLGYCGLAGRPLLPSEQAEILSALQAKPVERPESEAA